MDLYKFIGMSVSVRALIIVGVLLAGGGLLSAEGYAQSWQSSAPESSAEQKLPTERESNAGQVPDWADTRDQQGRTFQKQPSLRNDVSTKGHNTEPGIPISGTIWLILTGGGYATWKLRSGKG